MKIFLWGTVLLLVAFVLHLIIWRIRPPQRHTKTLIIIFYGTFIAWYLALLNRSIMGFSFEPYLPSRPSEYFHIFFYFCSTTFVYIGGYTLLEADSPSLLIVDRIHAAGTEGLGKDSLYASLNDEILVIPRINDLLRDQMATFENGAYKITPKGAFMVRVLLLHRLVMKADHKGG